MDREVVAVLNLQMREPVPQRALDEVIEGVE
jgi:hypothetical protein